MSLFNFRSKNPAAATPLVLPVNFVHVLVKKRAVFPARPTNKGESKTIARQLDVTLMQSGFKLSPELLEYFGGSDFESAITAANEILSAIKELIGDHVKHNPFFIKFPEDVPDTFEFWVHCLFTHYVSGEVLYGQHTHSFEEMVIHHEKLKFKDGVRLKTIQLGRSLDVELRELFSQLAGSNIPLKVEDRTLLVALFEGGFTTDVPVRIRENKALLNSIKLRKGMQIEVDTIIDVLRLACALSDGDVTLATTTKFKSFSRDHRRKLVGAIDDLIARDQRKVHDIAGYKERFKRLAEKLHPREYPQFKHVALLFDFAGGSQTIETFGRQVHDNVSSGRKTHDYLQAIGLLSQRPGMLLKNIDLILRSGDRISVDGLLAAFRAHISKISGRNLLNLDQHLLNRSLGVSSRIFVNRLGGGFATNAAIAEIAPQDISTFRSVIQGELQRRIPVSEILLVDDASLEGITVPISEKSKSDGFSVLPRGSTFPVMSQIDGSLRFFIYWKERAERTDYDLSCAFYDAEFQLIDQVSWTNLRDKTGADAVVIHSGDFTSAPNGATEFIDIKTNLLDSRVVYILPSINFFAGENFAAVEEAFFGFMERPENSRGFPFEAKTVSTKFALKGTGKVCLPAVFIRKPEGDIGGKWLDIYSKGHSWANRVESHTFTTVGLAKAILEKSFLPLTGLVDGYRKKAKISLTMQDEKPKVPMTYIGLRRPDGLHVDSKIITLESFRSLIPE